MQGPEDKRVQNEPDLSEEAVTDLEPDEREAGQVVGGIADIHVTKPIDKPSP